MRAVRCGAGAGDRGSNRDWTVQAMNAISNAVTLLERSEERAPVNVFVVSPNGQLRQELQEKLALPRWNVIPAGSGAEAMEMLGRHDVEDGVLLLDPMLPDLESNEFTAMVRVRYPNTQVLMLNSTNGQLLVGSASPTPVSTQLADEVNRTGSVRTAYAQVEAEPARYAPEGKIRLRSMIGDSDAMQRTYGVMRMVAARDTTVLITGESGTGKDLWRRRSI